MTNATAIRELREMLDNLTPEAPSHHVKMLALQKAIASLSRYAKSDIEKALEGYSEIVPEGTMTFVP